MKLFDWIVKIFSIFIIKTGKYYIGASAGRKYCQASGRGHAKKCQHHLQTSASSFILQAKK